MADFATTIESFRTTIMSVQSRPYEKSKLKFISPEKWKNLMFHVLSIISEFGYTDPDLVHDLSLVISQISQDKFVQAILSVQPFKPQFKQVKFLNTESSPNQLSSFKNQTNSDSLISVPKTRLKKEDSIIEKGSMVMKKKHSKQSVKKKRENNESTQFGFSSPIKNHKSFLKEYLQVIIQEETLKKEFERKYHPFKKIIDNFVFIVENKFKNLIENEKGVALERIQTLLTYDILVIQQFFVRVSEPYQDIFQSQNFQEIRMFREKLQTFIKQYIHHHSKISLAIRKIMRHFARNSKSIRRLQESIEDFIEIDKFQIEEDFQIQGCYIQSMNALMEFSQETKAPRSLDRLKQFRAAIARDVDYYYETTGQLKQREINAEVQIQIVRFVVCKLKGWIPQIFAQLKFLEVVYGDQEIAYKYDDASYIYAQLITVLDALEIESSCESVSNE